jgi:hypothetical protein
MPELGTGSRTRKYPTTPRLKSSQGWWRPERRLARTDGGLPEITTAREVLLLVLHAPWHCNSRRQRQAKMNGTAHPYLG